MLSQARLQLGWELCSSSFILACLLPLQTSMNLPGVVRVKPGNTVSIVLGSDDVEDSRDQALQIAQSMLLENPKGFDCGTMNVVKPLAPFKQGTKERRPLMGLHVTLALEGDHGWKAEDGTPDKVTEDMQERMDGRLITMVIDASDWHYLEGSPSNDESTKVVFRMAAQLDKASKQQHADLRRELELGPMAARGLPHLTLAGIAPSDRDFTAFRKLYCRPRPTTGFPDPYVELVKKQMWYEVPYVVPTAIAIVIAILAGAIAILRT